MKRYLAALGPGILFAGTCIGVSHLVQTTRAGADYGLALWWAIVLALILKYPFFEFAVRYTAITGKSVIEGYYEKGRLWVWGYLVITICTMLIVCAAIIFVTAGILGNLIPGDLEIGTLCAIILSICILLLLVGKYKLLDSGIKLIGSLLFISVLVAVFLALLNLDNKLLTTLTPKTSFNPIEFSFVIALMGWMPTAVDISAWTSLWTKEKMASLKVKPSLKVCLFDFNLGYLITAFLAFCFLLLGANLFYGSGNEFSDSSVGFASQFISIFTSLIGPWSRLVIATAAIATMLSTAITVLDGYARVIAKCTDLLSPKPLVRTYDFTVLLLAVGSYWMILEFVGALKSLVDLATVISFIVAPIVAYMNYSIIYSGSYPRNHQPRGWIFWLANLGLFGLTVFTLIYLFTR
jgi:Mn2+/Fe2+ NRAMP family transporter